MAAPKDKGITAREAAERFCTDWDWAGTVIDDPEGTQRQEPERFPRRRREPEPRDAASELTKMLGHNVDPPGSRRARRRAREKTPQPAGNDEIRALAVKVIRKAEKKGVLDSGVQSDREEAVFRAMKSTPRDADQFDGPAPRRLWATGRGFGAGLKATHELIATDLWFFEGRGELKVDIEANAAVGLDGGPEYVNLRIFDTDPAQAVARTSPLFIEKGVEQPDIATGGVGSKAKGKAKRTFLKTDIEADYAERVKEHRTRTGRRPTFEADDEWRKSKSVTYDRLRKLRAHHRTEEERKGGRPPRS